MLVGIITESVFGKSVALCLRHKLDIEHMSLRQALMRDWRKNEYGLVSVCADRPYFAAFEEISHRLTDANLPLTFACIKDSILTLGPLIIPGISPCYRCFRRRLLCQTGPPWSIGLERVVETAFDRNWGLISAGMLPTTPVMAAARVERHALLRECDYGQVTQVSLTEPKWRDFRVRRVHGCGCVRSKSTNRSGQPAELVSIVERLFYESSRTNNGRASSSIH